MRRKLWLASLALGFGASLCWPSTAAAVSTNLVIAEVQVGGTSTGTTAQELVSVYNNSDNSVNVTGWCLQYSPASNGQTFTSLACFSSPGPNTLLWLPPKNYAVIAASEFILAHPGYTADSNYSGAKISGSSGHISLINAAQVEIDRVGYDDDLQPSVGALSPEGNAAFFTPSLTGNQVFQRVGDLVKQDTDNNFADFTQLPMTALPVSGVYEETVFDACKNIDGVQAEIPAGFIIDINDECQSQAGSGADNSCVGLVISEVLPNPTGSDGGNEFIELFNPTPRSISLTGCGLQTSANSKLFGFAAATLDSGKFLALYGSESGLTLANSTGGSVWLIDGDGVEIYQADYPPNMEDDKAWALFPDGFAQTFLATPGDMNQLVELKSCPAGQFRNPDTGRCNNIVSAAAGLIPCNPGQQRNPATNRCRNVASLSSALKACAADQFRNPATNRCKKVESSSLKPCAEGQERNPETSRCRKASGVLGSSDIGAIDDFKAPIARAQGWLLAGASIVGALLYGLWEWRNEMILGFMNLKKRFVGS